MTSPRSALRTWVAPPTFISDNPRRRRSSTITNRHNANTPWPPRRRHLAGRRSRLSLSTKTSGFPVPASSSAMASPGSPLKSPSAMSASCSASKSPASPATTPIGIACSICAASPTPSSAMPTASIIPRCSTIDCCSVSRAPSARLSCISYERVLTAGFATRPLAANCGAACRLVSSGARRMARSASIRMRRSVLPSVLSLLASANSDRYAASGSGSAARAHHGSRKVLTARGEWQTPILFGVLDDRSRLACHLQWDFSENAENNAHGLSQAFQRRGLPRSAQSDNGSAMTAAEIVEGLNRLGVLHQTTLPYSPYQNAKIEILWGLVEGRFLAMLEDVPDLTLDFLNEATQAWVEYEYNRKAHSELGVAPIARFLAGPDVSRPCPDSAALRLAFTKADRRTQRKSDGTIVIEGHSFEVPNRYRHFTRVEIRSASWDLTTTP